MNILLEFSRKTWLLRKLFYYFFTPPDLTRHDDTAFGPARYMQSYLVKSKGIQKLLKQLEEPGCLAN